jgi:predicted Rossmann fold nucleotide-binding protein DprA/Smf involved in DNA uptake
MKRIGIVGSRDFTDYSFMKVEFLKRYNPETIECIYSGGAKGADSLARQLAHELNIEIVEILPDWDKYGKSAGYIRNKVIVGSSDEVLAFWDGISKGTKHSIDIAQKQGIPISILHP